MKIARAIPFAEKSRFRSQERACGSASSDALLPGACGGIHLPLIVALSGVLTLATASAATIPQSQARTSGAPQSATICPTSLSLSDVTVSFGETLATGLGLNEITPAPQVQTNSVTSATCCLDVPACATESGLGGSLTGLSFSSGKYELAPHSIALFNFSSHSPGKQGSRFRFGLELPDSPTRDGTSAEAAPPQPAQEWVGAQFTPSKAPELAPRGGLRLFNWSF
jgi:hypothetical protein